MSFIQLKQYCIHRKLKFLVFQVNEAIKEFQEGYNKLVYNNQLVKKDRRKEVINVECYSK